MNHFIVQAEITLLVFVFLFFNCKTQLNIFHPTVNDKEQFVHVRKFTSMVN